MAYILNIYKGTDDKPSFTGTDIQTAIKGLAAGTVVATGDYRATHTDDTGVEAESNPVDVPGFTVNPAVPAAPQVKLTAGDGKIDFSFAKVDGAQGYHAWIKSREDNWPTTPSQTLDANTLAGTFGSLTNGQEYTVAITAYNAGGESSFDAVGASDHATPTQPKADAPTDLKVTPTDDGGVITAGK
jgi:hypothetical protein